MSRLYPNHKNKNSNQLEKGITLVEKVIDNISSINAEKLSKIEESNLRNIDAHVMSFYPDTKCSDYCDCKICQEKYNLKGTNNQKHPALSSSMMHTHTYEIINFFKLMSSVNKKISFKMNIPTICFFTNGECSLLFMSKNENIIQKDAADTTTSLSRTNLTKYFVEANKKQNETKEAHNLQITSESNIRYFSSVVPSYIHGTTEEKEHMKNPKQFIFHKNRKSNNVVGGVSDVGSGGDSNITQVRTTQATQSANSTAGGGDLSEEVAIVKYLDKSFELLNEEQLRQLMKSNNNAADIDYIQSHIKPHHKESELMHCEYHHHTTEIKNPTMYEKSEKHIRLEINLLNKYSKEYVPIEELESYSESLKQHPEGYILYQTYKMIHFMEIVRDIKVKKLSTVWLKDEFGELCFFGIFAFGYEENEKVYSDISKDVSEMRGLLDKPLSQLEEKLLENWDVIKGRKLEELAQKQEMTNQHKKEAEEMKSKSHR